MPHGWRRNHLAQQRQPREAIDDAARPDDHIYEGESMKHRRLSTLTLSMPRPESTTLDLALAEVKRGAWETHLDEVQPIHLGQFDALRLEIMHTSDVTLAGETP